MKKVLSLFIGIIMLFTVCSAEVFIDMPDNWATEALTNAVNNGLIGGSDGYIRPDDPMTRAEMATIMVRAFGATKEADISSFKDVAPSDWYYSSMAKAVAMGAFNGSDGMLNPKNNITREETFAVLARMFSLDYDKMLNEYLVSWDAATPSPSADEVLSQFSDASAVAPWARELVAAIVSSGYVGGSNGMLNPKDNIKRSEFAAVMNRMVTTYIDNAGTYSNFPSGNVLVRGKGVVIENAKITGDLLIGEGSIDGAVVKDTTVGNRLVIREGKKNEVHQGKCVSLRLIRPGVHVDLYNMNQYENYDIITGNGVPGETSQEFKDEISLGN